MGIFDFVIVFGSYVRGLIAGATGNWIISSLFTFDSVTDIRTQSIGYDRIN